MMTKNADKKREQMIMFCMEDMVPQNHILRLIDKAIDWTFIYDLVEKKYCLENGRPSMDPVMLIKIPFIQYLNGIKSMRQTIREIEVNVAYRWFLGLWLCKLSILFGAVSGIVLLILSPLILAVTDLSGTANGYLRWMLLMCSYYMIGKSVNTATITGIFCAGGDSKFGFLCDTVTMWCITVPLGLIAAFVLKLPVLVVYFIVSLDETVKLPGVYRHYIKYKWVKDLTVKENEQ